MLAHAPVDGPARTFGREVSTLLEHRAGAAALLADDQTVGARRTADRERAAGHKQQACSRAADEHLLLGEPIPAVEARRIGLVNHVWPDSDFARECDLFLRDLAERSASAVQLTKRLLYTTDAMSFESALRAGADVNVVARMTDDLRAGVARFLDRA